VRGADPGAAGAVMKTSVGTEGIRTMLSGNRTFLCERLNPMLGTAFAMTARLDGDRVSIRASRSSPRCPPSVG
jgi:hypothetical protein